MEKWSKAKFDARRQWADAYADAQQLPRPKVPRV